ncbi:MAG: MFS transporter, partial [Ruminococcaceae bacterium]|nr:MFS transporter [Oscillospiraceae bacterium]
LALIFAGSWVGILGARIIDRFGKGIRTAPRDVMVAESSEKGELGRAFGIHKALDMAGSAIGILLSFFLLKSIGDGGYKAIFALSAIPVVIALIMFAFVKEKGASAAPHERERFWKNFKGLDKNLKLYLLVVFIFTLGNSSNTFLLLKASAVGFSSTEVILLYFLYSLTSSLLAIPFGRRSDKAGRKRVLVAGYITFAAVYAGFAFVSSKPLLIGVFLLYGAYTAMVAGVERAYISEISPPDIKGTMLGLHSTISGIVLLPASVIAGALWSALGAAAPFLFGALLSVTAALLLIFGLKDKNTRNQITT